MKRMVLKGLVNFPTKSHNFNQDSFVFFLFRDFTTALMAITGHYRAHSASKELFDILAALHLPAAYESVWINGLIRKLAEISVSGIAGLWLLDFPITEIFV